MNSLRERAEELDADARRLRECADALERAAATLRGIEPCGPPNIKVAPPAKRRAKRNGSNDWQPSAATVHRVLAAITEEPQSVKMITDAVGASRSTVLKAVEVLRRNEQVRLVGQGRSNAGLYALMHAEVEA